jgi:hypothetical protein
MIPTKKAAQRNGRLSDIIIQILLGEFSNVKQRCAFNRI